MRDGEKARLCLFAFEAEFKNKNMKAAQTTQRIRIKFCPLLSCPLLSSLSLHPTSPYRLHSSSRLLWHSLQLSPLLPSQTVMPRQLVRSAVSGAQREEA